jgi:excisionase family DNA binding protein
MDTAILVTVGEAARRLSLSKRQVYELAAAGILTKRYVGKRQFRLAVADVEAYAQSLSTQPEEEA